MGSRGRSNRLELSVVNVERLPRPRPPAELSEEEAGEWQSIVGSMPADHFSRDTWPMLIGYVRLTIRQRHVGRLIADETAGDKMNVDRWRELVRTEIEISRCLQSLATKMRLAQQSTTDARVRKPETIERPWD